MQWLIRILPRPRHRVTPSDGNTYPTKRAAKISSLVTASLAPAQIGSKTKGLSRRRLTISFYAFASVVLGITQRLITTCRTFQSVGDTLTNTTRFCRYLPPRDKLIHCRLHFLCPQKSKWTPFTLSLFSCVSKGKPWPRDSFRISFSWISRDIFDFEVKSFSLSLFLSSIWRKMQYPQRIWVEFVLFWSFRANLVGKSILVYI